ncbi:MAG: dihydropteroate synthase [Bacteroidetes bacterium]|nr:dihydropteroate synthase [Bacteroidota bacterium]MBS1974632.1 dihydropteroate synthase [Bacteroidota bacterium]
MFTLNCNGKLLTVKSPLVMGAINITPDSFYEGSRFMNSDAVLRQAEKMLEEGADILDIGGQSTRPGSTPLNDEEELKRIIGPVMLLHEKFPGAIISVDTYHSKVATETVAAGASMVNDISAGNMDNKMLGTVAKLHVPYICMHMQGTPQTMQKEPHYENATKEVLDFFIAKIDACKKAGVHDVIIDPGFGFGKTIAHNFELLRNLSVFSMMERPLLVGLSRKSTIYKLLGISASEALNGTTVMNTIALINGANILRVHDVKEAKEAVKLVAAMNN